MVHMLQVHNEKFDAFALWLGRIGFCSRGFVWASVGGIAISAAFTGSKSQGTQGALEVIADHPGGAAFLVLITLGLLCYSTWRFVEGLYGLQIKEDQPPFFQVVRGIITPFASCVAYLIFGVTNLVAVQEGIKNHSQMNITQKMIEYTAGKVALFVIAFFLLVAALMWVVDLIKANLFKDLDLKKLNIFVPVKVLVVTCAYLGTFGRAILFALLSVEFFRVIFDDTLRGGGFGVALQQLQYNTTGRIFLVLFGFLILLFGCFSVGQAFFKRFYKYKPHFRSASTRGAQESSLKSVFSSKNITKEIRYESQMDKEDDEYKVDEAVKSMHPEQKERAPTN